MITVEDSIPLSTFLTDLTKEQKKYLRSLASQDACCLSEEDGFFCTRSPGHPGIHVAHVTKDWPIYIWTQEKQNG